MSYIRGALPFLIYNPHTRDDILTDGIKSSFELSQEVPGGYENNVQVIRREQKYDTLIQDCNSISLTGEVSPTTSEVSCLVPAIAAALSSINVGDFLRIEGSSNTVNNGDFAVTNVVYNGSSIVITIDGYLVNEAAGALLKLSRVFWGPWEVLEPEIDYFIEPNADGINKVINFTKIPKEQDFIYVIHRGEATYNFVPTEKSVGPAQLSENLRRFQIDVFIGDGSNKDFDLTVEGDDQIISARSLEVSVDGVIKYGSDTEISPPFVGDFELLSDGKTIRFAAAPASDSKIYVRHLGFSTVSRRKTISPNQRGDIGAGQVGTTELAGGAVTESKLANSAVSENKIQSGAVSGTKILLKNNEWLNWKSAVSPFPSISVLKLDSSNLVTLRSAGGPLSLNIADSKTIRFTTSAIHDGGASGAVDLGTVGNKFKDANLSGTVSSANASLTGNLYVAGTSTLNNVTVTGDLTITGRVDSVDVSDLKAQVEALATLVAQNNPAGIIKLWAKDSAAPAGYLLCDGSSYSVALYPQLFAAIGYTFGGAAGVFNVPDFRGRFPLGKTSSGTGSGWGTSGRGGSLDHTHTTPNHTHGLANHTHSVPPHYHGVKGKDSANADRSFGSTLAISSSGSHTTSLSHSHTSLLGDGTPESITTSSTAHTHGIDLTTTTIDSSKSDGVHGHSETFTSQGPLDSNGATFTYDHCHTATTGDNDTDHTHNVEDIDTFKPWTNTSGTSPGSNWAKGYNYYYQPSGSDPNKATGNQSAKHKHSVTTSLAREAATPTNSQTFSHFHKTTVTFNDTGGHSHKIKGNTASGTDVTVNGSHSHTVVVPRFTGDSTSAGEHTHSADSFSGAIGNVNSGVTGDGVFNLSSSSWASSLNTGTPSVSRSDLGGATENGTTLATGSGNPAFQTINFIIKT